MFSALMTAAPTVVAPDVAGGPPRALTGARAVLLLGSMTALTPLAIDAYIPALPTLTRDLGASGSLGQLTMTALLLGLAVGQLVGGPISDATGRRRPALTGIGLFVAASLLCAIAPAIWVLIPLRFLQGASGAAAVVTARAVVRDLHGGVAAARMFALLILVMGVAPVVAPIAGAQLLRVTSWRGVFVALAVLGTVLFVVVARTLPETLSEHGRHVGGLRPTLRTFASLLTDRAFVGYAAAGGLALAAVFSYISGSPFVLQDIYGMSPQAFSGVFAANAVGFVTLSQVSARIVHRTGPRRLLLVGLGLSVAGSSFFAVAVLAHLGLPAVVAGLFLVVAAVGFTAPNATALALAEHGRTAGAASALVGVGQYVIGGAAAPLTGLGGTHTAVPLAVVLLALSVAAATTVPLTSARRLRTVPA